MPNIVQEELWKHPGFPGMIVVTTNATITTKGVLVMGRGAALQARRYIPGIDFECADVIREATRSIWSYPAPRGEMAMDAYNTECMMEDEDQYHGVGYYFRVVRKPTDKKTGFGIFQVKVHFRQRAELELIYRSVSMLDEYARRHPDTQIRLNYPGIGAGGLPRSKVEPPLRRLPDTVTICYRRWR